MMRTYLGNDADALDGFEFLTMAEAGESGHWSIVEVLAQRARDARTSTLAAWAKTDPGASLPGRQRRVAETCRQRGPERRGVGANAFSRVRTPRG